MICLVLKATLWFLIFFIALICIIKANAWLMYPYQYYHSIHQKNKVIVTYHSADKNTLFKKYPLLNAENKDLIDISIIVPVYN